MTFFKNAKVLYRGKLVDKIVCVENKKIVKILSFDEVESYSKQFAIYDEVDCYNCTILPSCIDINIFPLDRKLNAKAIHTLAKKALKGGVSTFFLNPYTQPSIDNEAMNALIQSIDNVEKVNVYPLIASVDSNNRLNDIDTLYGLHEYARAIFSNSAVGSNYLYQTMQYAKMLNIPVCIFPFDSNIEQGVTYESSFARGLGLPMITPIGQIKEVAKIKEMAKFLDIEVILMTMNIAYCLDMVCHEKNIYTQVGLPHLIFSEQNIKYYDTRYKIIPPLLTRSKKEKLVKRLQDGKVSLLTSMQKAVSKQFKEQVFEFANESVEGLEHFFSLAYTLLVRESIISLPYLVELVSTNASNLMKLNKGVIEEGRDADFMIIDLEKKFVVDNPLSLYHDMEVYGKIQNIVINGTIWEVS